MPWRVMLLTMTLLLGVAGVAHGQGEDGVTYDPDSPAGKEYALPIDDARGTGGDDGGGGGAGSTSGPAGGADSGLFGAGVSSQEGGGSAAGAGGGGGAAGGSGGASDGAAREAARAAVTRPGPDAPASAQSVAPTDGPDGIVVGGIAGLVAAALALTVGLGVRRRQPTPG